MKISTKALFKRQIFFMRIITYAQINLSVQKFTKRSRVNLGTVSNW